MPIYTLKQLLELKAPATPPPTTETIKLIEEASQRLREAITRYPKCPKCNKAVRGKKGFLVGARHRWRSERGKWHYGHARCTPNSAYAFGIERFQTLRDVLDWTCHLGGKPWFSAASWLDTVDYLCPQFIQYVQDAVENRQHWSDFIFRGKKPKVEEANS